MLFKEVQDRLILLQTAIPVTCESANPKLGPYNFPMIERAGLNTAGQIQRLLKKTTV